TEGPHDGDVVAPLGHGVIDAYHDADNRHRDDEQCHAEEDRAGWGHDRFEQVGHHGGGGDRLQTRFLFVDGGRQCLGEGDVLAFTEDQDRGDLALVFGEGCHLIAIDVVADGGNAGIGGLGCGGAGGRRIHGVILQQIEALDVDVDGTVVGGAGGGEDPY